MSNDDTTADQSLPREGLSLQDGLALSRLTHTDLWLRYIEVGGVSPRRELIDEIARDSDPGTALEAHEHNLIAQALNDHFVDHDHDHPVAYREDAQA